MMNFGCYGNGGGSSSSPSNLSALAPPFTVDRSNQKPNSSPLVDLTEPHYAVPLNSSLHNWLGLDSTPSSTAYRYSPTTHLSPTDVYPYGQTSDTIITNLAEAKPYYPTYVSPTIHDNAPLPVPHQAAYDLLSTSHVVTFNGSPHDDYPQNLSGPEHTTRWGGLWEGLPSWDQGKPMDDGGLCSKDVNIAGSSVYNDYMNQGIHASQGFSTFEEASPSNNRLRQEKQVGSTDTDQLDYKSFVGKIPKFMPSDYSRTSVLGSTSLLPETYPQEPTQTVVNSRNCQMPYSASYEKCLSHHDNSLNDSTLVMKPFPTIFIRPPAAGTSSSAPSTGSFKDVNIGSDAADKNLTGVSSSTQKEPYPLPSPEGKICFDASQLSFHLGKNEHPFSELLATKNQELSSNRGVSKDALDHLFNAKSRLHVPFVNPDGFNLSLDGNKANNPVQNSSESLDHYIPAVDSPCWKGASVSCFSPFKASETISPQLSKKLEAYNASNFQGPQIFLVNNTDDAVKVSSQKPSENSLYHESGCLENGLVPSPKRPAVANMLLREHVSDYAVKSGLYHKKPSSGHVVQSSNDNDESKKEYALSNRSIDDSDIKPSHTMQQRLEAGVLTSEKKCASGTGIADVEINIDDASEASSSHVPFHAAEHVLCSPSSADDTPAKLIKSHGGESTPKTYVQTLVNTMHNLSELLLFHCSNEACELKEKDWEALKNVINNLDKCVTKNAGPSTSTRESFFTQQATSQFSAELSELQEGVSVGRPQVRKVAPVNFLHQPNYQHVQEEKKHRILSGKEEEKSSDFVSVRGDADIVKYDNMTQAIKEILTENLHDEEETQPQNLLYKNLWLEAEAALCSINYMARFNRMKVEMEKCKSHKTEDLSENAADAEKVSRSKFSPRLNTVDKLASEVKGGSTPDIYVPGSPILSTSSHADDVMARLNILKCRVDNSDSVDTADVKKLSWSTFSSDLSTVNKLASEAKGGSTLDRYVPDSPVKSTSSCVDDVMARLNILNSRFDNSNSMDTIDVEKLSTSKVYPTLNKVDKLDPEGKNSSASDKSIVDSSVSGTDGHADDVEASVMARFHILKCRADSPSSVDMEGQQQPEVVDLGLAGERKHWSSIKDRADGTTLEINVEPVLQHYTANRGGENLTMKEFYLHVKDDPVIQCNRANRLGDQLGAGWYDSSSSDWEHVLKEELTGQNC